MSDEGSVASHKSQCADHSPTRNFFSHEKQTSDCFHVNKVNASIRGTKKL